MSNPLYTYRTRSLSNALAAGLRPQAFTAEALFDYLPADGSTKIFWQSFGTVSGVERFSSIAFRRGEGRVDALRPNGDIYFALPLNAGRDLRVLVR